MHPAQHIQASSTRQERQASETAAPRSIGTLAQLARIADSRSGAMLIGVGITLIIWQYIAQPEIKAAREIDRSAMREITGQLQQSAALLNAAAVRLERTK